MGRTPHETPRIQHTEITKEGGGLREERKKDEACKSGDKRLPSENEFFKIMFG